VLERYADVKEGCHEIDNRMSLFSARRLSSDHLPFGGAAADALI
jgi:hypothetical protein